METQKALRYADQLVAALGKKLPDYKFYPRLIESVEYNFVEIGIQPNKGSVMDQSNVAYSQQFFDEMEDNTVKATRAKRVYKDIRIVLGLPAEDA